MKRGVPFPSPVPASSAEKFAAMQRPPFLDVLSVELAVSPSPSQTSSLLLSFRKSAVAPRPCSAAAEARRRHAWSLPVLRSHVPEVARTSLMLVVLSVSSGARHSGGAVVICPPDSGGDVCSRHPVPSVSLPPRSHLLV